MQFHYYDSVDGLPRLSFIMNIWNQNHQEGARGSETVTLPTNCKQLHTTRRVFWPENGFVELKISIKNTFAEALGAIAESGHVVNALRAIGCVKAASEIISCHCRKMKTVSSLIVYL
jgi:hypothetical protein